MLSVSVDNLRLAISGYNPAKINHKNQDKIFSPHISLYGKQPLQWKQILKIFSKYHSQSIIPLPPVGTGPSLHRYTTIPVHRYTTTPVRRYIVNWHVSTSAHRLPIFFVSLHDF